MDTNPQVTTWFRAAVEVTRTSEPPPPGSSAPAPARAPAPRDPFDDDRDTLEEPGYGHGV